MIRSLQALLQALFLRVEAVFNRAFGDRLNPLYHLGSISFYLFWLVAASGLYLYAFFETGVADAYASVDALTYRQWFAGGVLRSVHRYASDAMVQTEADRFHDYWVAKPGKEGRKLDWLATWRNWCRTAFAPKPSAQPLNYGRASWDEQRAKRHEDTRALMARLGEITGAVQ